MVKYHILLSLIINVLFRRAEFRLATITFKFDYLFKAGSKGSKGMGTHQAQTAGTH